VLLKHRGLMRGNDWDSQDVVSVNEECAKDTGYFRVVEWHSGETPEGSNRVSPRLATRVRAPGRHMAVTDCTAVSLSTTLGAPRQRGFASMTVVMTRSDPSVATPARINTLTTQTRLFVEQILDAEVWLRSAEIILEST